MPTFAAMRKKITSTLGSQLASMMQTRYGVRSLRHGPGSAVTCAGSIRCCWAHIEGVTVSGHFHALRSAWSQLVAAVGIVVANLTHPVGQDALALRLALVGDQRG